MHSNRFANYPKCGKALVGSMEVRVEQGPNKLCSALILYIQSRDRPVGHLVLDNPVPLATLLLPSHWRRCILENIYGICQVDEEQAKTHKQCVSLSKASLQLNIEYVCAGTMLRCSLANQLSANFSSLELTFEITPAHVSGILVGSSSFLLDCVITICTLQPTKTAVLEETQLYMKTDFRLKECVNN